MSCWKVAPSRCLQRWTLHGCLPPGLLLLKPLDLLMHRRESFLLELIAQRVGGSLLCFSNQSLNFREGNTMQLCLLKFRLWESQILLHSTACWELFRCLHLPVSSGLSSLYISSYPLPLWSKAAAWLISHYFSFSNRWPPGHEPSFHDRHRQHGSCCLWPATWPRRPEAESRQPDRPTGQDHEHRGGEYTSEGSLDLPEAITE